MLTAERLGAAMPRLSREGAAAWAPRLSAACARFDVSTPARLAAFLAQVAHESAELTRFEEGLDYSAARLCAVWPSRFRSLDKAQRYAHSPERLANLVYAGRMGNGDEASGDGWRYRGRGPIQITGRENVARCGAATGFDLLTHPELLFQIGVGSLSAAWYWHSRGLNELADRGGFDAISRRINGGTNGMEARRAYWRRAKAALGVS